MSWKGGPRSQIATCKTFPSAPPVFTITLKHTPNLVWSQTLCFILDKGLGTNGLNLCNRCKLRFSNLDPVWGLYFDLIGQFLERGCNWEKRKIDPHWAMPQRYLVYLFQNVLSSPGSQGTKCTTVCTAMEQKKSAGCNLRFSHLHPQVVLTVSSPIILNGSYFNFIAIKGCWRKDLIEYIWKTNHNNLSFHK